jgi:hypothetical protein
MAGRPELKVRDRNGNPPIVHALRKNEKAPAWSGPDDAGAFIVSARTITAW